MVGVAAGSSSAAEAITTSGTIWSGKGLSLGLGLGLGIWGPVIVIASGAAAFYAYLEYRKRLIESADEVESDKISDEGFFPNKE